ncbi:MAG: Rne/Rng family ribonuclease, partial [Paracoccaceae bacterium]
MAKKMLIDATHPEETRVVVVDGNKVDDFDFESVNKKQLSGNIYLAKVTRVEPSLQAAFVEYGGNRHGFLAFAEIHPDYYQIPVADREALVAEEAALVREEAEAATRGAASTAKSRRSSKNGERAQARGDTGAARADDATAGAETTDPENGATATATGTDGRAKDAEAGASENRASGTSEERASGTSEERASGTGEERSGRGRRGGRRRGGKDASSPRHGPSGAFDVIEPDGGAPARGVSGMETAGEEQADEAPATATEASTRTESAAAAPAADRAAEGAPASAGAPARTAATPDDAVAEPDPAAAVAHEAVAEDAAGGPSFGEPLADAEASEEPTAATGEPASSPDALGETGAAPADPSPVADTDEPRRDDPATPNEPDAAGAPDDEDDGPSRSMAEDTGLGEDDVVRGEVEAAAEGGSEAGGDAPARAKPRRRKRAKDAAEGAPAAEAEETGAKPKRSRRGAKASAKGDKAGRKARKPEAEPADERPAASDGATEEVEAVPAEVDTVGAEDLREEALAHRAIRRRRYKIQDVVKSRQIMLVQVVKEERGNKGAALTTYLSLAGRYCVLMPNTARGGGISRKITNAADRKRLREIVGELEVPEGMGLIVRTAGAERTRAEIRRDYEFLLRQWEQVRSTTLESSAPCLIYEEGSLIKRAIRDLYSKEIEQVLVEGEAGYREAKDYMKMLMPSHAKNVQQYSEPTPLYIRHQVESYLNGMFSPVVQLKSGGYIVIGVTEALVAIDVNSGRSTREGSIEDTAVKTNLEAADEVARQLRLRDLAGLIVIDFIDMDERRNNAAVEKRMKERLKTDRARIQVGRISAFGLMEMSRQRLRPGMLEATTRPCHHCHGQGMIRSDESMALGILREIEEEGVKHRTAEIVATMPVGIANYIMNFKRAHLARIEERYDLAVQLLGDPAMSSPDYRIDRAKAAKQAPATAEPAVTATSVIEAAEAEDAPVETPEEAAPARSGDDGDGSGKKRRRGKRGGRRRRDGEGAALPGSGSATAAGAAAAAEDEQEPAGEDEAEER